MRFPEKFPKSKAIADRMQCFFESSKLERVAIATKFVQKESPMTGAKFAQICIGGITEQGLMGTLGELCTLGQKLGVELCEQSLNERFNAKAVAYVQQLFEKALYLRFDPSVLQVLESFSQIKVEDSTVIKLPPHLEELFSGSGGDASKAALKIDYTYNVKAAEFVLHLRSGKQPDSSMSLGEVLTPKSLWLRDLGYFGIDDFEKMDLAKACYISRLRSDVNVYLSEDEEATPVDLAKLIKKLKENQVLDLPVFIGKTKRLPTRLILQRLPQQVAAHNRRKVARDRRRKGSKTSKTRLDFCDFNAFITNLEAVQWPPHLVMQLYKIRWQIEILFKVWKSILKIGQVQRMKAHRFLCLLYAQLLWAVLNMSIFQAFKNHFWNAFGVELSELKGYKLLRSFHKELIMALWKNQKQLYEQCLQDMYRALARFGKKQCRKNNPNPLFICEKSLT